MSTAGSMASRGFWLRTRAMLIKEFIQLRRDRMSFGMIIMIPLMQLVLFGYAINTTPRDLPTAVLLQETSDVGRSILAALQNTRYFKVTHVRRTTRPNSTGCSPPARCCSRSKFRRTSSARCGAATGPRCWSRRTRPIRSRPARRSARSAPSSRPRCATITPSRTPPRRRSRCARMRATIRRPRPRSTSCRAWSARSSR